MKTKRILKRVLATATAVALALTCFSVTSLADTNNAAKVGEKEYATLQEALDNAEKGTVVLLRDVTESVTVSEDAVLDLGTFTLTNNGKNHTVTVNENAKLTVEGNGVIDNTEHGKGALVNNGEVVIKGGTMTRSQEAGNTPDSNGGNSWYVIDNHGTITMNGGSVTGKSGYSSLIRNIGATFNMNAGTLDNNFIVLKNDDNGKINMTGGTITTKAAGGSAIQNWGTLEMTGGTLNAEDGAVALYALAWSADCDSPVANISGSAVINGKVQIKEDENYPGKASPTVNFNGGQVNGSVEVGSAGNLTVNDGVIKGAVTLTSTGEADITGGTVMGKVSSNGENKVAVSGGTFYTELDDTVDVQSDMKAVITSGDTTKTVVGKEDVQEAISQLKAGDHIRFDAVAESEEISIPEGVAIKNNTGADMTINGVTVAAGAEVIVKDNSGTDGNGDSNQGDKPAPSEPDKAEETPETGDDTMIMGFAVMMLAALGLGGVLVATRRTCRK